MHFSRAPFPRVNSLHRDSDPKQQRECKPGREVLGDVVTAPPVRDTNYVQQSSRDKRIDFIAPQAPLIGPSGGMDPTAANCDVGTNQGGQPSPTFRGSDSKCTSPRTERGRQTTTHTNYNQGKGNLVCIGIENLGNDSNPNATRALPASLKREETLKQEKTTWATPGRKRNHSIARGITGRDGWDMGEKPHVQYYSTQTNAGTIVAYALLSPRFYNIQYST
ncbi:hypothetical protein LX36DRAFT_672637 [Colletotrichum falcatum]|nr:hypothetical protein LX36DRAFT_672637 [Colletotrichum falcatum]